MKENAEGYWLDEIYYGYEAIPENKLKKLDKFLRTKCLPGGCSSLVMFDGFAAGIVAGAGFTPYDKKLGMSVVWGQTHKTMKGVSTKQEVIMEDIIQGYLCNVFFYIKSERHSYDPLLDNRVHDAADTDEWCRGFMKAFNMAPQGWAPIFISGASRNLIAPFIFFGGEGGWNRKIEDKHDSSELVSKLIYELPFLVSAISDAISENISHSDYFYELTDYFEDVSPYWKIPTSAGEVKR